MTANAVFITGISSRAETGAARLLIDSIQSFGGELSSCPIQIYAADPANESCRELTSPQVEVIPLSGPEWLRQVPFGDKVLSCAEAERRVKTSARSLIWMDLECLVVQPPLLFDLRDEYDAALRPVHIRNVGVLQGETLDLFWGGIATALRLEDIRGTVETFIDRQLLRAYYNTHGFSINPALGLGQRWYAALEKLVFDRVYMTTACSDPVHRVFLFQAIFSALVSSAVEPPRIRILPAGYNYPYNLHGRVLAGQRAAALNDLVCFTFEGRPIHPAEVTDIAIREPLRS